MVIDDQFFLAQLDTAFDRSYGHLAAAMQGFLRGWNAQSPQQIHVDKNRAWLHAVEFLLRLEPSAKLIVCIRELGQIYGSIEAQHQRTILIDFIDHLADYDRFGRADMLFAKDKTIGAPLISLHAVLDLPASVRQQLYFLRFEDLVERPVECMSHIYAWLGVAPLQIDPERLDTQGSSESDSHYRMKFTHQQRSRVALPPQHDIPQRIQARIQAACAWYYSLYYPS